VTGVLVHHGRRVLATALARAGSFLLEPVEEVSRPTAIRVRPVVAVVGLAQRCGTTTVARALAVELSLADPAGAAVVGGPAPAARLAVAGAAAGRLARALGGSAGRRPRVAGRLCLVEGDAQAALAGAARPLAPLVFDVGHGRAAGVAVSLADHVLLVASPAVEPALATVVAASLARVGPAPRVVLNGGAPGTGEPDRWDGRVDASLEHSPLGARLALAGRDARGSLGTDLADLAEGCEAIRSEW
jgi:hypothetical protein